MKKTVFAALAASSALVGLSGLAQAQEAPAFRVPLEQISSSKDLAPAFSWIEQTSSCSTSCGTGTRVTSYQCQDVSHFDFTNGDFGAAEPAAQCVANVGPAPAGSEASCTNYAGCGFDWVKPEEKITVHPIGDNPAGRPGCGDIQREFNPSCERDGEILPKGDHAFCRADLPDYNDVAAGVEGALGYDRRAIETSACNASDHAWKTEDWSEWSSTCSTTAMRTRVASCYRKFDGSEQPDAACPQPKPKTVEVEPQYGSCTYSRTDPGQWGSWSSGCDTDATRTRSYSCRRSNGDIVAASECTARGISLTETEASPQYGSCTYSRTNPGKWSSWSSGCDANATRTRTYECRRSNGDIVASSECTSRGIDLRESESGAQYGSCSHKAVFGAWTGWSSDCSSSATRTRSVYCERSNNGGTRVSNSECTSKGVSLSPTSETQARYGSCSYARVNPSTWGAWSSSCSSSAKSSRSYQCRRSDGTIVSGSECTSRGISLSETRTSAQYGGCSYQAVFGGWSGWSSDCSSAAVRTRSVYCRRSDGSRVADSECTSRGVSVSPTSETQARYGSCSYSRVNPGSWSAWSSTCSASASSTRSYQCRRSDGAIVSGSECTSRGISLSETRTAAQYGGCSYRASGTPTNWGPWSSTCSANATRTRTYQCRRSDGTVVASSECTSRGVNLTETTTGAVYSGCTYSASLTSSVCTSPGYQTRTYRCRRSDGTPVDGSYCGYPGGSQTVASSACYTYAWSTGAWSAWGACTSSSTRTRTRAVTCRTNGGTAVSDSQCSGTKPVSSEVESCNPYTMYRKEFGTCYSRYDCPAKLQEMRAWFQANSAQVCTGSKIAQSTTETINFMPKLMYQNGAYCRVSATLKYAPNQSGGMLGGGVYEFWSEYSGSTRAPYN